LKRKSFRRFLRTATFYVASTASIVAFVASPAAAQRMTQCSPVDSTVYNIFLDDIRPFDQGPAAGAEEKVRKALYLGVFNSLEILSQTTKANLKRTECTGRYPAQSDFTKEAVDPLDNRKVVLELWGTVRDAGNNMQASLNFVVIPARLRYLALHQPPAGILEIRRNIPRSTANALFHLFERNNEIEAYAFIGAGLKALNEKDYDAANSYLCDGEAALTKSLKFNPDPTAQELLTYVHELGDKIVQDAQNDPGKNRLKLLGPGQQSLRCRLK